MKCKHRNLRELGTDISKHFLQFHQLRLQLRPFLKERDESWPTGWGFPLNNTMMFGKLLMIPEPITYPKLRIATLLPSSAKKHSKDISTKSSPFFGSPFVGWSKLQPCSRPEVPLQECGFTLDESWYLVEKGDSREGRGCCNKRSDSLDVTKIAPWSTYK